MRTRSPAIAGEGTSAADGPATSSEWSQPAGRCSGSYGTVSLDGLGFIVLGLTPEAMGKGNWSVGVIADDRASAERRDAITAIATGGAGGPMAALSGLVGTSLGVESAPIRFDRDGVKWSVQASSLVDMAAEGTKGINPNLPINADTCRRPTNCHGASAPLSPQRS